MLGIITVHPAATDLTVPRLTTDSISLVLIPEPGRRLSQSEDADRLADRLSRLRWICDRDVRRITCGPSRRAASPSAWATIARACSTFWRSPDLVRRIAVSLGPFVRPQELMARFDQ